MQIPCDLISEFKELRRVIEKRNLILFWANVCAAREHPFCVFFVVCELQLCRNRDIEEQRTIISIQMNYLCQMSFSMPIPLIELITIE